MPRGAAVSVVGNLSVDLLDGGAVRAGGCPAFAAPALAPVRDRATIFTAAAPADRELFAPLLAGLDVPYQLLEVERSSSFALRYTGDDRAMTVAAVGHRWTPELAEHVTGWVHLAPLLRSDFPTETVAALAAGCRTSFDGQGLVRAPVAGPLRLDANYDPALLRHVSVLKLADEEARIVAGGAFDVAAAARLGVPEILVTFGNQGCDLYVAGEAVHVPPAWPVRGVDPTGAGDMFSVAYVAARASDLEPSAAAHAASRLVAEQLEARRTSEVPVQNVQPDVPLGRMRERLGDRTDDLEADGLP